MSGRESVGYRWISGHEPSHKANSGVALVFCHLCLFRITGGWGTHLDEWFGLRSWLLSGRPHGFYVVDNPPNKWAFIDFPMPCRGIHPT